MCANPIRDLKPGMVLEGVVSNVAAFGAFVDLGVHQDGLVHVSALSEKFVKDPREVVKAGDIVKVKVMEVDIPRQRIGLSMRLSDEPGQVRGGRPGESREPARGGARPDRGGNARPVPQGSRSAAPVAGSALADAFARARGK